jgi:hypothetical protein
VLPAHVRLEREGRASDDERDPRRTDRIAGLSPQELALRVLAPSNPQRAEVCAVLESIENPDEGWEALAARGFIPMQWMTSGARQILSPGVFCARCRDRSEFIAHAVDCERAGVPATVVAAATIAANVEGVATAEALALTVFERLYGEIGAQRPTILWRVADPATHAPLAGDRPGSARAKSRSLLSWDVFVPFMRATNVRRDFTLPEATTVSPDGRLVALDPREMWRNSYEPAFYAVHRKWMENLRLDAYHHWGWALSARETRPNPFTPLLEVWALGYAVEVVSDEFIVLFAPALREC